MGYCYEIVLIVFLQKQATREEDLKSKVEERTRRAEIVKLNKLTAAEGSSLGPESA